MRHTVPALSDPFEKLTDERTGEPSSTGSRHASSTIRERVEAARERQRERFAGSERLVGNGDTGAAEIRGICVPARRVGVPAP
jgi:predicted ATPase with chaperone activity